MTSSVHAAFFRLSRNVPLYSLPPDFVSVETTPPVKRPYSAEMPEVMTAVSWMASSMKRLCGCPRRFSLTTTPLTMKTLSYDGPPLMVIWLLTPFGFTPGESRTVWRMSRATGSRLTASCLKFAPTCVVSSTGVADAVTVMASVTADGFMAESTCWVDASASVTLCVLFCMPSSSKVTLYAPGGSAANV